MKSNLLDLWVINYCSIISDFLDFKPITTRKLRRRLNPDGNGGSSSGAQEKRRKQSPTINILLDEAAINEDLKLINKVSGKPFTSRKPVQAACQDEHTPNDARIEDGKLYFEKRWLVGFVLVIPLFLFVLSLISPPLILMHIKLDFLSFNLLCFYHIICFRYSRGQAIYADSKETGKFGATISSISATEVLISVLI